MLLHEFPVCSTSCVVKHPSLSSSKFGTKTNISAACFAITIYGIFNSFVCFVVSEGISFCHLDQELTITESGMHFRHCGGQASHVILK